MKNFGLKTISAAIALVTMVAISHAKADGAQDPCEGLSAKECAAQARPEKRSDADKGPFGCINITSPRNDREVHFLLAKQRAVLHIWEPGDIDWVKVPGHNKGYEATLCIPAVWFQKTQDMLAIAIPSVGLASFPKDRHEALAEGKNLTAFGTACIGCKKK